MFKEIAVGLRLRVASVGVGLAAAACSAVASDFEKTSSVQEALTLTVPYRVRAIDFTSFKDSDTLHEGNCGGGPVDQQTVADNGATCGVAYTKAGEWLDYSLRIAAAGKFNLVSRVASNAVGKTFRLSIDGVTVGGSQSVPSAGWASFADRPLTDVALTAGTHTLRVLFETGDTNLNYIDVTPGTASLPQRIEAENYQRAFESTPASNSGTGCNRGDGVDKEPTNDAAGGCLVGWAAAGEWLEYDVVAPQAGLFDFSARLASGVAGRTLQLSVDGTPIGSFPAPSTGWTAFEDRTLQNVSLSAGSHVVRALFVQGDINLNYLDISLHPVVAGYSFGATVSYNAFVFQDLSVAPSVAGPVAAGRDISSQGFSYNTLAAGPIGALAGRNFSGASGNVQRDLVYGAALSLNNVTVAQGTSRKATPVDFAAEKATLDLLSANLANVAANGTTVISPSGTIFSFTGTDPSRNVFSVNGAALAAADQLNFSVPATSTVIVNVTGTAAVFETASIQLASLVPGHLLWNFPQATTVRVTQTGFKGTLLGINAAVAMSSASLDGVLLAASLTGSNTGITWQPFNGSLTVCSVAALTIVPGSPQLAGTPLALSATASCADNRAAEFHYDYLNSATAPTWREVAPGFASSTVNWSTASLPAGSYQVRVVVRRVGEASLSGASATSSFVFDSPIVIPTLAPAVENFDGLGSAIVGAPPSAWRIDKQLNPRTLGTFAAATNKTEFRAGALLPATADNGIYNFGAGVANAQAANYWLNSTDRALGWLSAGSALASGGTKSGNLYVALRAPADQNIGALEISYDIEKYFGGTNAAGFRVQLYSSTDGGNWTSAGNDFLRSFSPNATDLGFDPAPGQTVNVPTRALAASIPRSAPFYLAWNYTIDSATSNDGSHAPALAIDSVSIKGTNAACVPNCSGKVCGGDLSDGCGQQCAGVCGGGQVGCVSDTQCQAGLVCGGHVAGTAVATVCVSPTCLLSPQLLGCGHSGAPCGPSCTRNPICESNDQCPTGYECGAGNGHRYGAPGANVCQLPACKTNAPAVGCGTISDECGLCQCTPQCENKHCGDADLSDGCGGQCPATCGVGATASLGCARDFDCQPGSFCAIGQGPRLGFAAGSNVCLPKQCTIAAANDCGTVLSLCGLCPPPMNSCSGRECGSDPVSGVSCGGDCADNQVCTATGRCTSFASTPPIIVADGGNAHPVVPPTSPPAVGLGASPGSFRVTEQGSASYSIPIDLPPGRHGLVPSLQIGYTSSTGNGTLGVGWSLDGLSTISRCNKNYAQVGQASPVRLDWDDAFCLDGQRLIEVEPGEFRTEVETFARIRRLSFANGQAGGAGTGSGVSPEAASIHWYFEVMTKDGRRLLYGSESQSCGNQRSTSSGAFVRTWALNRVEDRNGNFIHIVYRQTTTRDSGVNTSTTELVPDSISYTGNGVVEGDREVKFEYSDDRLDKLLGYQVAGGSLARTLRLERISVRALGALVRRYDLHYEAGPNRASRLASVQECDGPNSICKGATTFRYKTDQGFDAGTPFAPAIPDPKWGAPMAFTPYGIALSRGAYDVLVTRSDNGTTVPITPLPGGDLAALPLLATGPFGWAVSFSITLINLFGSTVEHKDWFVDIINDFVQHTANVREGREEFINDGICPQTVPAVPQVIRNPTGTEGLHDTCEGQPKTLFIDVDGDGVQDRLQCSTNGQQIEFYLARNHNHEPPTHVRSLPGPDGSVPAFKDFCASERAWAASPNSATEPPFITAFDVDGDGTSNLLVNDRTGFSALFFDGSVPAWHRLSTDFVPIRLANYYVALLDANGDGLRDVLALPISVNHEYPRPFLWTNTGTGFELAIATGDWPDIWAPDTTAYVVDYDKDGIDDLIQAWAVPKPGCDPHAQVCENNDGTQQCSPTPAATACINKQKAWSEEAKLPHNWSIRRFIGGSITSEEIPGPAYPGAIGDFDGDGNLDLVTRKPDNTGSYFMHHGSGRLQNALETVTDGLGRRVDVHYDRKNPEGKSTYGNSTIANDVSKCSWPNVCAFRLDQPLVSSFEQKHSEEPGVWQTDVDTRLSYGLLLSDAAGVGTLGFDLRHTTVRDGAGVLRGESTVAYVVPLSSAGEVAAGRSAIEAPYYRAVVGVPLYTYNAGAHADSTLTGYDDDYLETYTDYHWAEQTSASGGRPFAVLRRTVKSVSAFSPENFRSLKLSRAIEVFEVDGFGNTTYGASVAEDFDAAAFNAAPVPNSASSRSVRRTFDPSPADVASWLISKPKLEEVTDQPRCYGGASSCSAEARSRRASYDEYYDSGEIKRATRAADESAATRVTTYDRDSYGNVSGVTERDATGITRTVSIGFDTRGIYPISYTDGLGRTTQVRFDERFGKLTVSLDPNEIARTWSYDDFGILRHYSGPDGQEVVDYDLDQRLVDGFSAKYAVARQAVGGPGTIERFNSLGQIVSRETSGLKGATVVESFHYDYRNRLQVRLRPHLPGDTSQGAVRFTYDGQDQLQFELHPDGVLLSHARALVSLLTPELSSLVPSSGGAVSVIRTRDAAQNATYQFLDRDGRPVQVLDANKRATNYTYGAFGAVRQIVGPNGTLSYDYDNYGRMSSSSDAAVGGTTSVRYNGLDEVVSTLDPANRATNIHYDELGRTKWFQNADGITSFTYDVGANALGRLTQTVGPTGQQTNYSYEPKVSGKNRGLLASITQSLLAPDAISSTTPTQLTTTYHFDEFSRLEQVDYPGASGFAVKYGFDSAGNVISVADPANSANFYWQISDVDQGYRLKQETLGNGVITERHHEALSGRLDSITTKRGSVPIQQLTYGYQDQNLTRRTNVASGVSETFGYDALNRVTSTTYSNRSGSETVTYDPVSNAISHKDPVGNYSYHAQGRDWVRSAGDTQYSPDALGNIKTRSGPNVPGGTQEYVYTTFNLPSHVSLQSGPTLNVDFGYDADGTRVVKQTDAETTYYAGDLYQRTTSASVTTQRFMIYAGGRAVAAATQTSSSAPIVVSYLHDDALGSIETITASDASVVAGRHFDAFGDARGSISTVDQQRYGYTGQEQDPELGLVNMRGRMYDPRLGQFLSPDPVIQSPYGQGLNRFAYVFNSPLNYVDPSGFSAEEWETGLGLGVPYAAGLVATLWASGGSSGAAVMGAEMAATPAAMGAGAAATSVAEVANVAVPTAAVGTAIVNHLVASGRQPVRQFKAKPPSTRSTQGPSTARTDFANSPTSARRERAPTRTPAEAPPASNSEWNDRPDLSHIAGPYAPGSMPSRILSHPINTDQSAEMFETAMQIVMAINPIGGPGQRLLTKLGSRLAAKLAARGAAEATKLTIQFGKGANQVSHAFRHVDTVGLERAAVQSAVEKHLPTVVSQLQPGKPLNQIIEVAGQRLQYTAYLLKDGIINVGRIHPVP
ncbi:MAG TPA: choice-of-anchor A family protein [Polyangiaceae bacterium]|nr:choice-of-anchor A family protein [Polyangiaceae bacterium]